MDKNNENDASWRDLEQLLTLPPDRLNNTILSWLIGADERQRSLAERYLLRDRPRATKLIVSSALASGVDDVRRVQWLAAVERLGLQIDVAQWFDLTACMMRFSPEVQSQIGRVLVYCKPGGAAVGIA
jgi:hypothetical protein